MSTEETNNINETDVKEEKAKKGKGRPKGSFNKRMKKLKDVTIYDFTKEYKCTMCGTVYKDIENFLSARGNVVYQKNDEKLPFCRKCCNALQEEYMSRFKDEKIVFMIMCHYLGYYFDEVLYEKMKNNSNFSFNKYISTVAMHKRNKNFVNTIVETMKNRLKETEGVREEVEEKWTEDEKSAKEQCIEWVGYDCFTDKTYSDKERKWLFFYLFNNCTDDILEDNKKMNAMIEMCKTQLQIVSMNEIINKEIKDSSTMDYTKVEKLVNIKNKLSSTYNDIANENGLSQKSSGVKVRRSNALTSIMKEMMDSGFEDIKANYIDSKMSNSYREIAEFNAKALQSELLLSTDDYGLMVARQSEKIVELQNKVDIVGEENRKLKIQLKELKGK